MKRHREDPAAVSFQRGDASWGRTVQANKMPPRHHSGSVLQRALHSASASKADQLLHKQGAQTTSARNSELLMSSAGRFLGHFALDKGHVGAKACIQ